MVDTSDPANTESLDSNIMEPNPEEFVAMDDNMPEPPVAQAQVAQEVEDEIAAVERQLGGGTPEIPPKTGDFGAVAEKVAMFEATVSPVAVAQQQPPTKVTRKSMMLECRSMQDRLRLKTGNDKHPLVVKGTSKLKLPALRVLHAELDAALGGGAAATAAPQHANTAMPSASGVQPPMEQLVGGAMFLSVATAEVLEVAVNQTADYHGYELKNYSKAIQQHEGPLKDAYRKILEEEGANGGMASALGYLNTPYAQLGMIFAVSAMSCAQKKEAGSTTSGMRSASSDSH